MSMVDTGTLGYVTELGPAAYPPILETLTISSIHSPTEASKAFRLTLGHPQGRTAW